MLATFPCIDIIGVLPVLYTHLHDCGWGLPHQCTSLSIPPLHHCRCLQSIPGSDEVLSLFLLGIYIFTSKQCYFKMLCLLVFYLHHALLHLHVFSGREKCSRKIQRPRQRQRQRQRQAKTHRAERKRTMESNFSLLLNWAASPDSLVQTWTLSGSN